jgi:hypothetical protein
MTDRYFNEQELAAFASGKLAMKPLLTLKRRVAARFLTLCKAATNPIV